MAAIKDGSPTMIRPWVYFACASTMVLACHCGTKTYVDATVEAGSDSGVDGGSDAGAEDAGMDGAAGLCDAGTTRDCYTGPPGTVNVGECMPGSETCNAEGTDWGTCVGEVLPSTEVPTEPEETPADEDCDTMIDET